MNFNTVKLDVRDDIRNGREPFSKIMNAVAALCAGEQLLVIAPFEPVPLFRVLEQRGFRHTAQSDESGNWEMIFTRQASAKPADATPKVTANDYASDSAEASEVDARGLEPPQPMVRILETLVSLPIDARLRAHTDWRPMHLFAHLQERGFAGKSEEQNDGSFITTIWRV